MKKIFFLLALSIANVIIANERYSYNGTIVRPNPNNFDSIAQIYGPIIAGGVAYNAFKNTNANDQTRILTAIAVGTANLGFQFAISDAMRSNNAALGLISAKNVLFYYAIPKIITNLASTENNNKTFEISDLILPAAFSVAEIFIRSLFQ